MTHNLLPEFEHFETNHRQIVASLFQFMGTEKEEGPQDVENGPTRERQ